MLFAVLGGLFLALAVRYLLPGRHSHGAAVLPAIGAATSAVVWAGLTWLEWPFDGAWIWVVSIAAGPLVALVVGLALPPRRERADAELFEASLRA